MQVHNALLTSMTTLYRPPTTSPVDESSTNAAGARPVSARAGTFPAPPVEGQPAVTIAPPADSGVGVEGVEGLTVEGLLEAWGTNDDRYDLNADGTVNVRDLLALLAELSDTTKADETTDITGAPPTGPEAFTDLVGQTPPLPPEEDPLTIEGLKAAWGTDDARYDLNLDGTVNVQDLLALLAQISGARPQVESGVPGSDGVGPVASTADAASTPVTPPLPPEEVPLTIEGLREAWGTDNARYDLNADGTVNVRDLLALLAQLSGGQSETVADPADTNALATANEKASADNIADEPTPLEKLLAAWGTDNPRYDLNADGTVNVQDLLAMLGQMSGGHPVTSARLAVAGETARPVASSLLKELEAAGFDEHPPSNIHELVGQLNLAPTQRAAVLSQIAARYPDGLGLDVVV